MSSSFARQFVTVFCETVCHRLLRDGLSSSFARRFVIVFCQTVCHRLLRNSLSPSFARQFVTVFCETVCHRLLRNTVSPFLFVLFFVFAKRFVTIFLRSAWTPSSLDWSMEAPVVSCSPPPPFLFISFFFSFLPFQVLSSRKMPLFVCCKKKKKKKARHVDISTLFCPLKTKKSVCFQLLALF